MFPGCHWLICASIFTLRAGLNVLWVLAPYAPTGYSDACPVPAPNVARRCRIMSRFVRAAAKGYRQLIACRATWAPCLEPSLARWPIARLFRRSSFLLVEPYNRDRFVRFHSFQCIGFWLAALVIGAVVRAVAFLLFFVPLLGYSGGSAAFHGDQPGFVRDLGRADRKGAAGRDVQAPACG